MEYELVRGSLKSYDLLLFRTPTGVVPKVVSKLSAGTPGFFSGHPPTHCGLVIRGDVFSSVSNNTNSNIATNSKSKSKAERTDSNKNENNSSVHRNRVYIFESTYSGSSTPPRIDVKTGAPTNKPHLGVQLRNFDEVVAYCRDHSVEMAWAPLVSPPPHTHWSQVCAKYDGIPYDINIWNLLSTAIRCMRVCRCPNNRIICSELVSRVYADLGLFDRLDGPSQKIINIDYDSVLPVDFVVGSAGTTSDLDQEIPAVCRYPIRII